MNVSKIKEILKTSGLLNDETQHFITFNSDNIEVYVPKDTVQETLEESEALATRIILLYDLSEFNLVGKSTDYGSWILTDEDCT